MTRPDDDPIDRHDLSKGLNDWYNVTPSVRRAIEHFATVLDAQSRHLERLDRVVVGLSLGGLDAEDDGATPAWMTSYLRNGDDAATTTPVAPSSRDGGGDGAFWTPSSGLGEPGKSAGGVSGGFPVVRSRASAMRERVDALGAELTTDRASIAALSGAISQLHAAVGTNLKDRPTTEKVREMIDAASSAASGGDGGTAGDLGKRVAALESKQQRDKRVLDELRRTFDARARADESGYLRKLRAAAAGDESDEDDDAGRGGGGARSRGRGRTDRLGALAGASVSSGFGGSGGSRF